MRKRSTEIAPAVLPSLAGGSTPDAMSARGLWVLVILAQLVFARVARADDDDASRAAARKVALDGISSLQAGDAAAASAKLEKAYRVLRVPSVGLWSARALARRGLLVEASERYLETGRLPIQGDQRVQQNAQQEAAKELEELAPRIPSLLISVEGADGNLEVSVDSRPIPPTLLGEERPTNPGTHTIIATWGGARLEERVTLAEREKRTAVLRFAPGTAGQQRTAAAEPAVTSSPDARATGRHGGRKTVAYVALAAGGLGIVVGGVFGAMALNERKQLDDQPDCQDGQCLLSAADEVSTLRTMRTVSTVGFIAGGALLATGAVLIFTWGDSEKRAAVPRRLLGLGVAPSSLRLWGQF